MNPRGSPTNDVIVGRSLESIAEREDGRKEGEVVVEMMQVRANEKEEGRYRPNWI
jgi:hypothetical protein